VYNVHSTIEQAVKKKDIFLPSQYIDCVRNARRGQSFRVVQLEYDDMVNWSEINAKFFKPTSFKGIITKHHIIYTRCVHNEIGSQMLPINYKRRGRQLEAQHIANARLNAKTTKPTLDTNKKSDLQKLCKYLPVDCRPFYQNL